MPEYKLAIRIDPLSGWNKHNPLALFEKVKTEDDFRKKIYTDFDLKSDDSVWAELDQSTSGIPSLITYIRKLKDQNIATFGEARLYEHWNQTESDKCEWFRIDAEPNYEFIDLRADYPTCVGYRLNPTVHLYDDICVSSRYKQVAERNELSGIDFLWIKDTGTYRSLYRYCAIPREPLGHGVDHGWFDRRAFESAKKKRLSDLQEKLRQTNLDGSENSRRLIRLHIDLEDSEIQPLSKTGQLSFYASFFKSSWSTGNVNFDRLLCEFNDDGLLLSSACPRFLRSYAPQGDFAYGWPSGDGVDIEGKTVRSRILYCNRRTRDFLIEERVAEPTNFVGVALLDATPNTTEDLDSFGACPEPFLTAREFAQARVAEKRWLSVINSKPKPIKAPTMKNSLSLLREAARLKPDNFQKGLPAKKINLLTNGFQFQLPLNWQKVLHISQSGDFGSGETICEVFDLDKLLSLNEDFVSFQRMLNANFSEKFLCFAGNDCGDYYALDFRSDGIDTFDIDCPVVLLSHETGDSERIWAGISDFLESVLTDS